MIILTFNPILHGKKCGVLLCSLLLAGCQLFSSSETGATENTTAIDSAPVPSPPAPLPREAPPQSPTEGSDQVRLQQCKGQLDALKIMNASEYQRMRRAFDYLMSGAAQYADVRSKTSSDTQDTVDSMYRYRANLLCAQISQTLLDSLAKRGEARP